MKKLWKFLFVLWMIISFFITVIHKLSFGVIFFDLSSIYMFVNFVPFDFVANLIRNYMGMTAMGMSFPVVEILYFVKDFLLNVCLFIPCGLLLRGMGLRSKKTFLFSFYIVMAYEIIQLSFRVFNIGNAVFDINDILAAIIGTFIGNLIWLILCCFLKHKKKQLYGKNATFWSTL